MNITPHFSLTELTYSATARRLGLANLPNEHELDNIRKTAAELEKIRAYIGRPIIVTSCYRSEAVNQAVGGSKTSAHRYGSAADIKVDGLTSTEVAQKIIELRDTGRLKIDQIILEFPERGNQSWVHIGFRWHSPMRNQILTARKIKGKTCYLNGLHP